MSSKIKNYLRSKLKHKPANIVQAGEILINFAMCDGCGKCTEVCPVNVFELRDITDDEIDKLPFKGKLKIKIKGRKKSYSVNEEQCIQCGSCKNNCHEYAIQVG